ncbi:MAG: alpha-glucosidase [Clostridiales bacterium]|nr:alpha-glucosidase [Clostridiales bacterium]
MLVKFRFGSPIQTDAMVCELPLSVQPVPYFQVTEEPLTLSCPLPEDAVVYGLGEAVRGINKRGWIYESNNTDQPHHTEDKRSLYGSHNFLMVSRPESVFALFVDDPGMVRFDVGYTQWDRLTVTVDSGSADVYVFDGDTETEVVHAFRGIIGRSYLPPKWAFGFGQSRWSYATEGEVREVVENYRERGFPLDAVYLDIDYMDHYKNFTVDTRAFPDLKGLAAELKGEGVRLVPIIDAGVKMEKGYDACDEGLEKGYFCTDVTGQPFRAAVWPGLVYFPDFLNPKARDWFGEKYRLLLEQGIEGFWNDMNEPAIFYSPRQLNAAIGSLARFQDQEELDLTAFSDFSDLVSALKNSPEDYRSFFHALPGGSRVRHDRVHNLYGFAMTRSAGEGLQRLSPDRRTLLFSRASYIGAHRYGGIWQGDNQSWWSHLELNIRMMPSLNMVGFLYTGADLGGFGGDATEELLLRWTAFGVFTPLMRNHSAIGTRRQELYRWPRWEMLRNLVSLRYFLLPYLYSEYMKAALNDGMLFRPLAFDYRNDPQAIQAEDQLLLGESVMLAPVYRQNATGRYVYLPEEMKLLRLRRPGVWTEEILPAGHHYIPVALDEVPLFLRPERLVPVTVEVGHSVEDTDFSRLSLLSFVREEAHYLLYDDDGFSRTYSEQSNYTAITLTRDGKLSALGSKTVLSPDDAFGKERP